MKNYAAFGEASFDLRSSFERPIVLFTGNNGAGKTSTLEAFRLALYGRRAFAAITEEEYQRIIRGKFNNGNFGEDASISLAFEFADSGNSHFIEISRTWSARRRSVVEVLALTLDGEPLERDLADDLISNVVPPEVLRYFFFDGEKIGELADWDTGDDSALFSSVNELLGLNLTSQLERDLTYVASRERGESAESLMKLTEIANEATALLRESKERLKEQKQLLNSATRRQESCRRKFMSLGGVFAEERSRYEGELSELNYQIEMLEESVRSEALAVMPLLAAPNVFADLEQEVAKSEALEVLAVIKHAISEAAGTLESRLKGIVPPSNVARVIDTVRETLTPKPVALDHEPLDLSLREASWMRSVLGRELPALKQRLQAHCARFAELLDRTSIVKARLELAPTNDNELAVALVALEDASKDVALASARVQEAERSAADAAQHVTEADERLRKARHNEFRNRRLHVRDEITAKIVDLLPCYADRVRHSKESRFSSLLLQSLNALWSKEGRLKSVDVDLALQTIDLHGLAGDIDKRNLSAAEKQLFAIAFIFSLAKLSKKNLPFVIDTPLARLDSAHRTRLLAKFLPAATHQVILFSTDTEVVGDLYNKTRRFISHHYELADYNGGVTKPVQLAIAL